MNILGNIIYSISLGSINTEVSCLRCAYQRLRLMRPEREKGREGGPAISTDVPADKHKLIDGILPPKNNKILCYKHENLIIIRDY